MSSLLQQIDLRAVTTSPPQPDRFVYTFDVDGQRVVVGEQDLTDDLGRLARLLLD